jgi:autotransporter translocation and assembly factor TamB
MLAFILYIIFLVALVFVLFQFGMVGVRNGGKTGIKAIDKYLK